MSPAVFIGIASVPEREDSLFDTLMSLHDQADRIYVYLDGYAQIPSWLYDTPKTRVSIGQKDRLGDAGKFLHVEQSEPCYFLTCDDDLVYPPDHVSEIVSAINHYGRRVAVGYHGWNAKPGQESYHRDRAETYHFNALVHEDTPVDVLGTGTCGFYTKAFNGLSIDVFQRPNMADLWFSVFCNEASIARIVLGHEPDRFTQSEKVDQKKSIYYRSQYDDAYQTRILNAINWSYGTERSAA